MVAKRQGTVQISSDNGETWQNTGFKTETVSFVDRNDNIYHYTLNDPVYGTVPLFKISAESNYTEQKCVIDTSDMYHMTNNHPSQNGVNTDYNIKTGMFGEMAQDDDGYIYAGRYQTEWSGAVVYVSDESGENFVVADFRTDRQHVHTIMVNNLVYPNEVYICIDDAYTQPLAYVTTDHLGYEEIKDDPDYQLPNKARSTGGYEGYRYTDINELGETRILMPANRVAQKILEHSKKHVTQVPVPYRGNDILGAYFGYIEDRETSPEKFEYNEEKGKWYTVKNKSYYDEVNGKTHYYSDNVYALSSGEANVLGAPAIYKTTDIMNPEKYTSAIEVPQLSSRIVSPRDGIVVTGGLAGGFAQYAQLNISYDGGDNWERAFAYPYGYAYETGTGLGAFRRFSNPWYDADTDTSYVAMYGWGSLPSIMGMFGGEHYSALSNIVLPSLPAEGIKIFVKADGSEEKKVTSYHYGLIDGTVPAIMSTRAYPGDGDELKFPINGTEENMVCTFDIETENKTGIKVQIVGAKRRRNSAFATILFDTLNGKVTLNDKTAVLNADVSTGKFSVKIMTDNDGNYKVFVNDKLAGTEKLLGKCVELQNLSFDNVVLQGGDSPSVSEPITVYYSNVKYGETTGDGSQFILDSVSFEKDGVSTDEITDGTTIKSVAVRKLDKDITDAKLIACLYDENNVLKKCKIVDIDGDGTYDVGMEANGDGLRLKFILVKDLENLMPLKLVSCL